MLIGSFLDVLGVEAGCEVWVGLASSAWHIDQMGQPPRLGCLGMCTGQCAVVDVSSKCWRNMLEPGGALEARRKASEARWRESEGAGGRRRMLARGDVAGHRP